jgi:hypothetical protein
VVAVRRLLAPAALVLLLAAPAGAQSFLDAYKAGVEAAEAGDWARVESLMRTALAGRAEESDRLVRHLHFKPYLPHYYLGRALAERGACPEALEAFAESERQGVTQKLAGEHAALQAAKAACTERLAAEADNRRREAAAGELVARAAAALDAAEALLPDPETKPELARAWETGEPSLAARLGEARAHLERAERAFARARDGAGGLDTAADLARGTLAQVEAIRREAELRERAVAADRARAVERLEALRGSARELLRRSAGLASEVAAVGRRRAALEGALRESGEADPGGPIAALDELTARIEREMARLRGAAEPPPQVLLSAAEAWLRGDPEAVLIVLGRPGADADPDQSRGRELREPRARAHALLLRAAAAFSLYHAGGGRDPALLEAALQDARECRRTDPAVTPVPRAFSPRFRAFFDAAEPGPAAGAGRLAD